MGFATILLKGVSLREASRQLVSAALPGDGAATTDSFPVSSQHAGLTVMAQNGVTEEFSEKGAERVVLPPDEVPKVNGQILTGKQEHCKPTSNSPHPFYQYTLTFPDLKRELISEQVKFEITELNSPTALRRFGAPFKSEFGEVSPLDSELPILRYIFVHHVREFPFLDKAKEKEFWQDKLQTVCLRKC